MTRVRITIDRIAADRPLDRAALAAALRSEIASALAAAGPDTLGPGRAQARLSGRLPETPAAPGATEGALARATIGAIRR